MYSAVLILHSWLRWAALLLAIVVTSRSITGRAGRRRWTPLDDRLGLTLMITLDLQLLFGLLLYAALSPITAEAFRHFGAAMTISTLRFWAVEHSGLMLAAILLGHVARVSVRGAKTDQARHARTAVLVGAATLIMLAAIPWPGTPNGRPWVRW